MKSNFKIPTFKKINIVFDSKKKENNINNLYITKSNSANATFNEYEYDYGVYIPRSVCFEISGGNINYFKQYEISIHINNIHFVDNTTEEKIFTMCLNSINIDFFIDFCFRYIFDDIKHHIKTKEFYNVENYKKEYRSYKLKNLMDSVK